MYKINAVCEEHLAAMHMMHHSASILISSHLTSLAIQINAVLQELCFSSYRVFQNSCNT